MKTVADKLEAIVAKMRVAATQSPDAILAGAKLPKKITKTFARQVAQVVDKPWIIKSFDDIRGAAVKAVLLPMLKSNDFGQILDNQDAVRKWAHSLSKDDLKSLVRFVEDVQYKGRQTQYQMSDKAFEKLAATQSPDAILDGLANDIKTEDAKKLALDWMAGAFASRLAGMLDIQVSEAISLVKRWAKSKTASTVVTAAADIKFTEIEFISGQEPKDDLDDEIGTSLRARFTVSGKLLAKMLGKQMRVLEESLDKVTESQMLYALDKIEREVLKMLRPHAVRFVGAFMRDEFDRGLKTPKIEFSSDTLYWDADIKPKKQEVEFVILLSFLSDLKP